MEIIARVDAELPDTRIYLLSVKPSVARLAYWDQAQALTAPGLLGPGAGPYRALPGNRRREP